MSLNSKAKALEKDTSNILKRFIKKDFSGNTGLAVKNSFYNLCTSLIGKFGSLIFTIIIARLLMPELFGLYSLALSTIVVFSAFADLGLGSTIIKFISSELAKKNGQPGKYYFYLLKVKFVLTSILALLLLASAYFIANYYYDKPIFYALLAGSLYIFATSFLGFFSSVFQSYNNFKDFMVKEIIFQIFRLILVPLSILFFVSNSDLNLFFIIFFVSVSYFLSLIYLLYKKPKIKFKEISLEEKSSVNKFILPLSATVLSGIFFGYIDIIMLGRFVEAEYIGFYQAAIALIGSAGAFVGFTAGALFPLFSRLKGVELNKLFSKSIKYTTLFSIIGILATLFLASFVVNLVYGANYENSIFLLRIFALVLLLDPLIGVYTSFFISQNRPNTIAKILIFSTILNICLNYFFISYGLSFSQYYATIGAACATLIAKAVHLTILIFRR